MTATAVRFHVTHRALTEMRLVTTVAFKRGRNYTPSHADLIYGAEKQNRRTTISARGGALLVQLGGRQSSRLVESSRHKYCSVFQQRRRVHDARS